MKAIKLNWDTLDDGNLATSYGNNLLTFRIEYVDDFTLGAFVKVRDSMFISLGTAVYTSAAKRICQGYLDEIVSTFAVPSPDSQRIEEILETVRKWDRPAAIAVPEPDENFVTLKEYFSNQFPVKGPIRLNEKEVVNKDWITLKILETLERENLLNSLLDEDFLKRANQVLSLKFGEYKDNLYYTKAEYVGSINEKALRAIKFDALKTMGNRLYVSFETGSSPYQRLAIRLYEDPIPPPVGTCIAEQTQTAP